MKKQIIFVLLSLAFLLLTVFPLRAEVSTPGPSCNPNVSWCPPPSSPPDGNPAAPVNIGSLSQTKLGSFVLGNTNPPEDQGDLTVNGALDLWNGLGLFGGNLILNNTTNLIPAPGKLLMATSSDGLASWEVPPGGGFLPIGASGETLRHDGGGWVANDVLFNNGTNIGIGTVTPSGSYKLDVRGSNGTGVYGESSGPADSGVFGKNSHSSGIGVSGESVGTGVSGYGSGGPNIGIGVSGSSAYGTGVRGDGDAPGSFGVMASGGTGGYGLYCGSNVAGGCGGNQGWSGGSDSRLKQNIQPIENALDKVRRLRGVTFQWKADPLHTSQMGFIAQEALPLVPEVVAKGKDDYYSMQTSQLTALLTEAMKEQQSQIEQQNQKIAALQKIVCADHPSAPGC